MLLIIKIIGFIGLAMFCLSIPLMKNAAIADWKAGIKVFRMSFIAGLIISAFCGAAFWFLTH